MGVDLEVFDVISWSQLESSIRCLVKVKTDGQIFRLIMVYGSSYEEGKRPLFLKITRSLLIWIPLPSLVGTLTLLGALVMKVMA